MDFAKCYECSGIYFLHFIGGMGFVLIQINNLHVLLVGEEREFLLFFFSQSVVTVGSE